MGLIGNVGGGKSVFRSRCTRTVFLVTSATFLLLSINRASLQALWLLIPTYKSDMLRRGFHTSPKSFPSHRHREFLWNRTLGYREEPGGAVTGWWTLIIAPSAPSLRLGMELWLHPGCSPGHSHFPACIAGQCGQVTRCPPPALPGMPAGLMT